jgi:hypothetical protein
MLLRMLLSYLINVLALLLVTAPQCAGLSFIPVSFILALATGAVTFAAIEGFVDMK